jgi:hypothetical protein
MAIKQAVTPLIDPDTLTMSLHEQQSEQQTWTADIFVPLTQNICGGAALGGLGFIGFVAVSEWHQVLWHVDDALLWCILLGAAVTCMMTIIRFFGDDLGLLTTTYKAGQRSMLPRISALETNLQATNDVLQGNYERTSDEARLKEVLTRAHTDAERLIRLYFEGQRIDRKSMTERGMGQRDWERARRLLQGSGVIAGDGKFTSQTPAEAIQQLKERYDLDVKQKAKERAFTPAWK